MIPNAVIPDFALMVDVSRDKYGKVIGLIITEMYYTHDQMIKTVTL